MIGVSNHIQSTILSRWARISNMTQYNRHCVRTLWLKKLLFFFVISTQELAAGMAGRSRSPTVRGPLRGMFDTEPRD